MRLIIEQALSNLKWKLILKEITEEEYNKKADEVLDEEMQRQKKLWLSN